MKRFLLTGLMLAPLASVGAEEREPATIATVGMVSQKIVFGVKHAGIGVTGGGEVVRERWAMAMEAFQPFERDEPMVGRLRGGFFWATGRHSTLEVFIEPQWIESVRPESTRSSVETGFLAKWASSGGWLLEISAAEELRRRAQRVEVAFGYDLPLKNLGAYLEWRARIGVRHARDLEPDGAGPARRDSYHYYETSLSLPYRIGGNTTVSAGWHLAGADSQSDAWSSIRARGRMRTWVQLGLKGEF